MKYASQYFQFNSNLYQFQQMFQQSAFSSGSGKGWLFRSKKQHDSTAPTINSRPSCRQAVKEFSFADENQNSINQKKLELETRPIQQPERSIPKLIQSTTIKRPYTEQKPTQQIFYGEMINRQIERDNFLSEKDCSNPREYNSYLQEKNRIAIGPKFKLPSKVLDIYDQISQSQRQRRGQPGPLNFIQGCLTQLGVYYYAINNYLLLYDIKCLYDYSLGCESLEKPTQLKFDDIVLAISQVKNLNTEMLNYRQKKDFLVISFPWKLRFYALEARIGAFQQIRLIDLKIQVLIRCQKALKVDYDQLGRFYYMNDKDGTLNCITFQENNSFFTLRSGKYSINNYKSKRKTGLFKTTKLVLSPSQKSGLGKRLGYFFRFLYNQGKSLFPCQFRIKNFFVDRLRNLVFCFDQVDQHIKLLGNKQQRTISLYKISQQNSSPEFLCRIPEQRVLKQMAQIWSDSEQKQVQIVDIFPVSNSYTNPTNIEVLLSNGTLLALYIGSNFFKFKSIQKPPCNKKFLQSIVQNSVSNRNQGENILKQIHLLNTYKQNIIVARQLSNEKIVACTNSSQSMMAITKNRNKFSAFFIQKPCRGQKNKASRVNWLGLSNPDNQILNETYQNFQQAESQCHLNDFFLFQIKNTSLLNLNGSRMIALHNQNAPTFDKRYYEIEKLHPIARQVYFPPEYFIFGSDMFIESCVKLRPIDVMFCILRYHDNRFSAQHMLYEYFLNDSYKSQTPLKNPNCYEVVDILCMLIQIYSDHQGRYFQGNQILRKIDNSQKSKRLRQQNSQQQPKEVGGKFVSYQQLSTDFLEKILEIIEEVSKREGEVRVKRSPNSYSTVKRTKLGLYQPRNSQVDINQHQRFQITQKVIAEVDFITIDFLRVHLSRILRLIWFSNVDEIPLSQNQTISRKLSDFKTVAYRILFLKQSDTFVVKNLDIKNEFEHNDSACQQKDVKLLTDNFLLVMNKSIEFLNYLKAIVNVRSLFKRSFDKKTRKISLSKFTFQEIFNKNVADFWERPIFQTYLRQRNKQQVLEVWKQMFPSFMSDNFRKVIKIYLETLHQTEEDEIIEKLKNTPQDAYLPQYFLDYLCHSRRFHKVKIYFNSPSQTIKQDSIRKQINQQVMAPSLVKNYADGVVELENIKNCSKNIRQKKLLLSQLQAVLKEIQRRESVNTYKFEDIYAQARFIKDTLSMQEIIKQSFLKIVHTKKSKARSFAKFFSGKQDITKAEELQSYQSMTDKLQHETFERKDLQQVVVKIIRDQQLSIIYYGFFYEQNTGKLEDAVRSFIKGKSQGVQTESQNALEWPACIRRPFQQILPKARYRISLKFLLKFLSQCELEKKYMTGRNLQQLIKFLNLKKSVNLNIGEKKDSWYDKMAKKFSLFTTQSNDLSGQKMLQKVWIPQFLYSVGYKNKSVGIQLLQLLETSFQTFLGEQISQFNEQQDENKNDTLKTYEISKKYVYYFISAFIFVKQLYPALRKDFFTIAQRQVSKMCLLDQKKDSQKEDYLRRFNYEWKKKSMNRQRTRNKQQQIIKIKKQTYQAMKQLVDNLKYQLDY